MSQTVLDILPTLLANKRRQEQLAQRQREFAVTEPYLQAQTAQAQAGVRETEDARKAFMDLLAGPGDFGELLPEGMDPETYLRGQRAGIFGKISPSRKTEPKTLEQIEAESTARRRGTVSIPTPPTEPKPLSRIEQEAAARARGTAGVPARAPSAFQKSKEIRQIKKEIARAHKEKMTIGQDNLVTAMAKDYLLMLNPTSAIKEGDQMPQELIVAYTKAIDEYILMLGEQLQELGYTAPQQPQQLPALPAPVPSADEYINRKLNRGR